MTASDGADSPLQPVRELFTRSVSALWATTYNVDLRLVSEFLLPALGMPPLNVTVLADGRRLGRSLARVGADTSHLARVNRRWLLRGVHLPGPTFHPKSYLSVAGRQATLLVGSGNLSVPGLEEGREVFTAFRSGNAAGDRAIAAWRSWMRRVIAWSNDPVLAERFADLESRLPPLVREAPQAQDPVLLHNLDLALLTQLTTVLPRGGVDELHLCAPFYDRDLAAVTQLLRDLQPRAVTVYVAATTNVDGSTLRRVLDGHHVRYRGFEPDGFTHAKIVGVVAGDRGWLLTGSANLSRSALLRPVSARGNVELAVLSPTTAAGVPAAFGPPGVRVVDRAAHELDTLSFTEDDEPTEASVRLLRAEALDDGRVRIVSEPDADPSWLLADPTERHRMAPETDGHITVTTVRDRLVRLVDAAGNPLSEPTVVDDPAGLAAALGDTGPQDRERPRELGPTDPDTVLGRALTVLNRELVMDVAEVADRLSGAGSHDEPDQTNADDFWDRLVHEQLAADPRAARYRQWRTGGQDALQQLRRSLLTPPPATHDLRASGSRPDGDAVSPEQSGQRWSVPTRLRVRVRNVLRRWAAAQSDPRLVWFDPGAPAINFTAIVYFLGSLRRATVDSPDEVALTNADLDLLWWEWLATFVGTGRLDGYLDRLDAVEADDVVRGLDPQVRETAAWLCWLTIRSGQNQRSRIVEVQPVVRAAIDRGLPDPTEESARSASLVVGRPVTTADIGAELLAAALFVDDDLWCTTTGQELELTDLRFGRPQDLHGVDALLHVAGISDPLHDVRLTRLLEAVARYRDCRTVAVYAAGRLMAQPRRGPDVGADWRVIYRQGEPITYFPSRYDDEIESSAPVDGALLQRLNGSGTPLAATFS